MTTNAAHEPEAHTQVAPDERLVPIWLTPDDLAFVLRSLDEYASTCGARPELQQHLTDLRKHFHWVLCEFVTEPD